MSGPRHAHDAHDVGRASVVRLAWAFGITATILLAEIIGAALTGSLALLADAAHMFTDTAGLAVALFATRLTLRPPTPTRTWGYRRAEILAAGAQASILLAVGAYALIEGVRRLVTPTEVSSSGLLVFGVLGLLGNLASLAILRSGRGDSLAMRAAFLEVVNDALGSVAVIASAVVIATTGWTRADAVAAILICLLIVPRAVSILGTAGHVLLESTPVGLDLAEVRGHLLAIDHVLDVHDLHASQVDTRLPILTAHVVLDDSCFEDGHAPRILDELQECVRAHWPVAIEHSTFQLEPASHPEHESPCVS